MSNESLAKDRGDVKVELLPDDNEITKGVLNFYVEEWKRGHTGDKNPREWFYVSDVGRCPRSIFYQFKNPEVKRDMAASTIMMFKMGDLFHDELQRVFRALGFSTSKHIEFGTWSKVGFMKRGRLDVLLQIGGTCIAIGDIKSKNPFGFKEPPPDYETDQLLSYMEDCRNDPYFKNIKLHDYGLLIYIDRGGFGTPPILIWKVDYSKDRVEAIKSEFLSLHAKITASELPDRPYIRDSVDCQYCRFLEHCWRDIPLPPEAKIEKDETIKPPAYEIVQSAAASYVSLKAQISQAEKDLEQAAGVLLQYFKSTGQDKIEEFVQAIATQKVDIDIAFLLANVSADRWPSIAKPQITMMRDAVKAGILDATTFELSKRYESGVGLRIIKKKKGDK